MTLQTALAVAASLVALAFALSTLERWLDRRRPHELAWTAALALFALAAGALAAGAEAGWSGAVFRAFWLCGAVLDVPFLALGTVYLLAGRRWGDRAAVAVSVAGAFAAGAVLAAPFTHPLPRHRLPQGSEVFAALPRVLAAVASGAGALVVFGGAVWSGWRFWHGHGRAGDIAGTGAAAAVTANGLIALGTLVLGASGLLNSVLDQMTAFSVTLLVGVTVLFAGFLVASAARAVSTPGPDVRPPPTRAGVTVAGPGAAPSPRGRAGASP